MFWKNRVKISEPLKLESEVTSPREAFPFPKRQCWVYISSKYKEVVFVPMGEITPYKSKELNSVITKEWPLNIGELEESIRLTLDKWENNVPDSELSTNNWHSFNRSKAKTQQSFTVNYVPICLTTDLDKEYGISEAERIIVKGSPKEWHKTNYKIVGESHLLETHVSQTVLDIFNACEKIRLG